MNPSTLDLLCMLGDKAVYVVMLMAAIGQPVEQLRLEAITTYSPNTLSKALAKLAEHRLAYRIGSRGPWSLTAYGQQLRLGESVVSMLTEYGQPSNIEGHPHFEGDIQKLRVNAPTTTTTQTLLDKEAGAVVEQRQPSNIEGQPEAPGPAYDQLKALGIGDSVARELSRLPHVTGDYVSALVADWRADKPHRRTTGMLVVRIREADQPAATQERGNERYLDYLNP